MGPLSSIIAATISDKFGTEKNSMTNSYIIMVGNLVALPMFICSMFTGNFWYAMIFSSIRVLFSECWPTPSIALLQASTEPRRFGRVFSSNLFFSSLGEASSIAFFGFLVNFFNVSGSHYGFGVLLSVFATFRYLGSCIAYYIAGKKQVLIKI